MTAEWPEHLRAQYDAMDRARRAIEELIDFLRAQLAVDLAVIDAYEEHRAEDGMSCDNADDYDSCSVHIATANAMPYRDPAFGRADITAKRRILDDYRNYVGAVRRTPAFAPGTSEPTRGHCALVTGRDAYEAVIRTLAQPYAGREGWRDEWAS